MRDYASDAADDSDGEARPDLPHESATSLEGDRGSSLAAASGYKRDWPHAIPHNAIALGRATLAPMSGRFALVADADGFAAHWLRAGSGDEMRELLERGETAHALNNYQVIQVNLLVGPP
jgi:hypothetical protein